MSGLAVDVQIAFIQLGFFKNLPSLLFERGSQMRRKLDKQRLILCTANSIEKGESEARDTVIASCTIKLIMTVQSTSQALFSSLE